MLREWPCSLPHREPQIRVPLFPRTWDRDTADQSRSETGPVEQGGWPTSPPPQKPTRGAPGLPVLETRVGNSNHPSSLRPTGWRGRELGTDVAGDPSRLRTIANVHSRIAGYYFEFG